MSHVYDYFLITNYGIIVLQAPFKYSYAHKHQYLHQGEIITQ